MKKKEIPVKFKVQLTNEFTVSPDSLQALLQVIKPGIFGGTIPYCLLPTVKMP